MTLSRKTLLLSTMIATACGGTALDGVSETRGAIVASDTDCLHCTDPEDTGEEKRGGGAGVGTSSTAAADAAKADAKEKACEASEATVTAPDCLASETSCLSLCLLKAPILLYLTLCLDVL